MINILNHLAIIMDGNSRWAQNKKLPYGQGHVAGLQNIKNICELLPEFNIKYLTLFAFSTENFLRPVEEINFLMILFDKAIEDYKDYLIEKKIFLNLIGDLSILNEQLKKKVKNLSELTFQNHEFVLNLAFNYGGRNEIIRAVKNIVKENINSSEVNEKLFSKFLYTSNMPDPDLVIRTGGHKRISNFLLWQISYAELFFCDSYWPDFDRQKLVGAIEDFKKRKRNYGI